MNQNDPEAILAEDRTAAKSGDFEKALQYFEWFIDNALLHDSSLYGVRLSFCLEEWASLGEQFPPAKANLEKRYDTLAASMLSGPDFDRFHDLSSISKHLLRTDNTIALFKELLEVNIDFAKKVLSLVRAELEAKEEWTLLGSLIRDGVYEAKCLANSHSEKLKILRQESVGEKVIQRQKDLFNKDTRALLNVLSITNRHEEFTKVMEEVNQAIQNGPLKGFGITFEKDEIPTKK